LEVEVEVSTTVPLPLPLGNLRNNQTSGWVNGRKGYPHGASPDHRGGNTKQNGVIQHSALDQLVSYFLPPRDIPTKMVSAYFSSRWSIRQRKIDPSCFWPIWNHKILSAPVPSQNAYHMRREKSRNNASLRESEQNLHSWPP
jgi:hypothetical protein